VVFGIFIKLSRIDERVLYQLSGKMSALLLDCGGRAQHSIREVYKQTVFLQELQEFPPPDGCELASIPLVGNICCCICSEVSIQPSNRNAKQKTVLQSTSVLRRNDVLPRSGTASRTQLTIIPSCLQRWVHAIHWQGRCPVPLFSCSSSPLWDYEGCCLHPLLPPEPRLSTRSQPTRPSPRYQPQALTPLRVIPISRINFLPRARTLGDGRRQHTVIHPCDVCTPLPPPRIYLKDSRKETIRGFC